MRKKGLIRWDKCVFRQRQVHKFTVIESVSVFISGTYIGKSAASEAA